MGHYVYCLLLSLLFVNAVVGFPGYKVTSMTSTAYGYSGVLELISPGPFGSDITPLAINVYYQTNNILRVRIYDPNNPRWEVPNVVVTPLPVNKPANLNYAFNYISNPFGFSVTRLSNNDVIFNTTSSLFNGLIFEDQFLELSTQLPNNPNIYGLGERVTSLRLPVSNTYTLFAKDHGTPVMENLYGSHPVYLEIRNTGLAHGVFLLNSNAMDVLLETNFLTYKTIGGILDFFVFLGPAPADVVYEYQSVVGNPHFPPYWALGWHQCRWGYHTIQQTEEVVANYSLYHIPLDTMWNDIDYMENYLDFTNDPVRFPPAQVRQFTENLHNNGQHYIMIVDPGISVDPGYYSYDQLMQSRAYITNFDGVTPIEGKVWPGLTYFPDFFHPNASGYWYNQLETFHNNGPIFDGVWIDMNEVSNFCNGQCATPPASQPLLPGVFNPENPPYVPGGVDLDQNTLNLTAHTYIGIEYNLHNLYGWSEGRESNIAMEKLRGKRSIVISRSTFPGTGSHNGHWLGDNNSDYQDLYYSIPGILTMQIFGVNLVGADICGFSGDTTEELCSRWMQLGAYYPFSRNHNTNGATSQEPYAFGPLLINISIAALSNRYSLLPYYYTLFANANMNGSTIWNPLFFEFPNDATTYSIDKQFLVGKYILVSPVLVQGATSVSAYFPQALWYDYYTGAAIPTSKAYATLNAPLAPNGIPVHIRGGAIIPTQTPALTTTATRLNPFTLLVALDQNGQAKGEIYMDDGEGLSNIENGNYTFVTYSAGVVSGTNQITNVVVKDGYSVSTNILGGVTVFGTVSPTKVTVNGVTAKFNFDQGAKKLSIVDLSVKMGSSLQVLWA